MRNEHKKMNSTMFSVFVFAKLIENQKLALKYRTKHMKMSSFIICLTISKTALVLRFNLVCVFALDRISIILVLIIIIRFLLHEFFIFE